MELESESEVRRQELEQATGSKLYLDEELRLVKSPLAEVKQKMAVLMCSTAPLEVQLADLQVGISPVVFQLLLGLELQLV